MACYGLTQALADRGHKITFVLPLVKDCQDSNWHLTLIGCNQVTAKNPAKLNKEYAKNIRLHHLDSLLRPYVTEKDYNQILKRIEQKGLLQTKSKKFSFSGQYGINLMAEVVRYSLISRELAMIPHDVIHAHDWMTVLAGIEAKKASGKPFIFHIHALEFDRCGTDINQEVYNMEKLGMEQADKVIAVSHYTKDLIVRHYGINPDKIEVVHNAVKRENNGDFGGRSSKNVKEKIVLFVGRITFQKGPDYFVETASKVLKKKKNVRFVMVGAGDMFNRMIERVAELKIGKHFHFTGFLQKAEVERIYSQSDVYVMPSVSEPFGISPLEAMQYNVPVIVSKQSGVAEILKNSLKVDFWDTDDMANKIIALVDHEPLRQEIIRQSAEELKHIQWEKAADRVTTIYQYLAH